MQCVVAKAFEPGQLIRCTGQDGGKGCFTCACDVCRLDGKEVVALLTLQGVIGYFYAVLALYLANLMAEDRNLHAHIAVVADSPYLIGYL